MFDVDFLLGAIAETAQPAGLFTMKEETETMKITKFPRIRLIHQFQGEIYFNRIFIFEF